MKFITTLLLFAGYTLVYAAVAKGGAFATEPWKGLFADAYSTGGSSSSGGGSGGGKSGGGDGSGPIPDPLNIPPNPLIPDPIYPLNKILKGLGF